jgi:hypothetical protein
MGIKEFLQGWRESKKESVPTAPDERRDEIRALRGKLKLFELIINRYRTLIERGETKTIADMKLLIKPADPAILKVKEEILEKFRPYIFEQCFLPAAEAAHEFVKAIRAEPTPVDFWLTPSEMLDVGSGDSMDKSIFLCSLLVALENVESYVIVGTNKTVKVAVGFSFAGEFHIIDPMSAEHLKGKKEEVIQQCFPDAVSIYSFNDREYLELKESEV